ncbi:MAG TPA: hypothetical protein VN873_10365 [Candidatus Angelobacter sp.]|nr:hypothetical protein [Candidatus Angelobacter sp.]
MIAAATDIVLKQATSFNPNWMAIGASAVIIVVTIMGLLLIGKR